MAAQLNSLFGESIVSHNKAGKIVVENKVYYEGCAIEVH